MDVIIVQDTDWVTRGPHIQHHLFERLSRDRRVNVIVFDYDMDQLQHSPSKLVKGTTFRPHRAVKDGAVTVRRACRLRVPLVRRVTSVVATFFEMLRRVRRRRPHVVVNYSMANGLLAFGLSRLLGVPFAFHYIDILHTLVPIKAVQGLARVVARFLLRRSDAVFVLNKVHRRYVLSEGVRREKVFIVPTGVSMENTVADPEKVAQLRTRLGIGERDFVIFFMGYLYKFAGLAEIVELYDPLVKRGEIPLKFLILGDGEMEAPLRALVKEKGADWVVMAGRVPYFELAEYVELATLCLQSFALNDTTREISPIKIFEYMAAGKPILSTRLPGIYDEIGEGRGVIFVNDQAELVEKIGELAADPSNLAAVGQAGRDYAEKHLDWEKITPKFHRLLIRVAKGSL